MTELIHTGTRSLDGCVEDADGKFDWFDPDREDRHRTYEPIWRDAEKVGYSSTLDTVRAERTRIERRFGHGVLYLRYRARRG